MGVEVLESMDLPGLKEGEGPEDWVEVVVVERP